MQNPEGVISKRYVGVLCLIAVLILIVGVRMQPSRVPAPVRSESELQRLRMLAQRGDLQRQSVYYQSRAVNLVSQVQSARSNPGQFSYQPPAPGTILLLTGTDSSGRTVWASATAAGSATVRCGGLRIEEIGTTIYIPATLATGVAFDLDDNVAGLVVTCGERRILTTPAGFVALTQPTTAERLSDCCGLRVTRAPEEPGVRIVEIDRDSILARAGAQVGDRVLEVNGNPAESEEDLRPLLRTDPVQLSIRRDAKPRVLKIPGALRASGALLRPSGPAVQVMSVEPGTRAERAKLLPGDLIIQAGKRRTVQPADVAQALESEPPADLVVRRGTRELILGGAL